MKKPLFLSGFKNWDIRLLSMDSLTEMQQFIQLLDDFFELCEGKKGSAVELLKTCPATKNINDDKFVLGIYDNHILMAILDIIRDYPQKDIWIIGYLLIHPKFHNQGIGSRLIANLHHSLPNITLRCVVQEQNRRALHFWKSNQFMVVNQIEETLGQLVHITYILEKRKMKG